MSNLYACFNAMLANLEFLMPKNANLTFFRPHGIFWKKEKFQAFFGIFFIFKVPTKLI